MTVLAFLLYFVWIIAFLKDFQELSRSTFALFLGVARVLDPVWGKASTSTNSLLCKFMLYTTLVQRHQGLVISPGSYWYMSFRPWNSFSTFFLFSLSINLGLSWMGYVVTWPSRFVSQRRKWRWTLRRHMSSFKAERLCILCKEEWKVAFNINDGPLV